jgi:hypothetical protein
MPRPPENRQLDQCTGKVRYDSFSEAEQRAGLPGQHHQRLIAYRCPFCGGFHLGATKRKTKRDRALKRRATQTPIEGE